MVNVNNSILYKKVGSIDVSDLFEMRKDPIMIEYTDSLIDKIIDEIKNA